MQPLALEELDIHKFIGSNEPLIKLGFSLDTAYLKQDFNLDLIIWNLSEDNLERTERIISYILKNFGKLFERAGLLFITTSARSIAVCLNILSKNFLQSKLFLKDITDLNRIVKLQFIREIIPITNILPLSALDILSAL